MPTRYADLLMYAALSAAAGIVIWQSYGLPNPFGGSIGSGGFPTIMAIAAIVLCAIGAARSLSEPLGRKMAATGLRKMIWTLGAVVALLGLWQTFGYFFPLAFVFLSGLLCLYAADQKLTWRLALVNIVASAIVIWVISLFFTHVLYVRF